MSATDRWIRGGYTRDQAEAIADEYIEMVYMPSGTHAVNIRRAARTVEADA